MSDETTPAPAPTATPTPSPAASAPTEADAKTLNIKECPVCLRNAVDDFCRHCGFTLS